MKLQTLRRTGALATAAVTLSVGLAACGSDDSSSASDDAGSSASSSSAPADEMTESESMDSGMDATAEVYGPACADIPTEGPASVEGMAEVPVATAASANPLLSTLVEAVTAADLVDTLNSAEGITVFAPANSAFEAIPPADLKALLADKEQLTTVLSHHVVPQSISPDQLSGEFETLAGDTLTIQGEGEEATIGTEGAAVLCGNVPTANATVYIVDSVLMPAA